MTVTSLLFMLALLTHTALAVVIHQRNPRGRLNLACIAVIACFVVWSFADVFHNVPSLPVWQVRLFSNVSAFGWCSFPAAFLAFVLVLVDRWPRRHGWLLAAGLALAPAVFIVQQFAGRLASDFVRHDFGWVTVWAGSAWPAAYYVFYLTCAAIGIFLLARARAASSRPVERRVLDVLLVTSISAIILGSATNVVLPRIAPGRVPELAGVIALIWASGVYYAARRHDLFSVTPAAAATDVLAAMDDAVLLLRPDGTITFANAALSALTGQQATDLPGRAAASLFGEPVLFEEAMRESLAGGDVVGFPLDCRRADGTTVPVLATARVVRPAGQPPAGMVWVLRNVTAQRRAERELRESERRYRSFVENFQGIAFRGGLDYSVEFFHGAVKSITGYEPQDFISGAVRWRAIIHPDDIEYLRTGTARLRTEPGCSLVREYRIIRKDGSIAWLREATSNVCDPAGQPCRLHGALFDITGERRAAGELTRLSQFRESVIDNASIPIVVFDREMHVRVWNRAAETLTGYRRDEVVGNARIWKWLFPDAAYRRELRTRGQTTMGDRALTIDGLATPITTRDGATRKVVWSFRPLVNAEGTIDSFIGLGRETAPSNGETEQTARLSVAALELAELAPGVDIDRHIADRLRTLTGAVLAFVAELSADDSTITLTALAGSEPNVQTLGRLLGRDPIGLSSTVPPEARTDLLSARLVRLPGGLRGVARGNMPDIAAQALEQLYSTGEGWAIGLAWQGTLYGAAAVLMPAGRAVPEPPLVEAFVRQATIALRRHRAEEALRQRETDFRAIAENASDGIAVLDENGIYLYANRRSAELLGAPLDRVIGSNFTQWVRPEDTDWLRTQMKRRLRGEPVPDSYELTTVRPDGRSARIGVSASRTTWHGSPATLVLVREITNPDG
jgi:PAS domain S-box-containing protein